MFRLVLENEKKKKKIGRKFNKFWLNSNTQSSIIITVLNWNLTFTVSVSGLCKYSLIVFKFFESLSFDGGRIKFEWIFAIDLIMFWSNVGLRAFGSCNIGGDWFEIEVSGRTGSADGDWIGVFGRSGYGNLEAKITWCGDVGIEYGLDGVWCDCDGVGVWPKGDGDKSKCIGFDCRGIVNRGDTAGIGIADGSWDYVTKFVKMSIKNFEIFLKSGKFEKSYRITITIGSFNWNRTQNYRWTSD